MTLGDVSAFSVRTALDEFDVLRVRPGTQVSVTLGFDDSIQLSGELLRVSRQARKSGFPGDGGRRAATFDATFAIREIPDDLRPKLRLGMSVRITLVPSDERRGIMIPLNALIPGQDGVSNVLMETPTGSQQRKVRLGRTTVDQVEVLQGVAVGDRVWIPDALESKGEHGDEEAGKTSVLPGLNSAHE